MDSEKKNQISPTLLIPIGFTLLIASAYGIYSTITGNALPDILQYLLYIFVFSLFTMNVKRRVWDTYKKSPKNPEYSARLWVTLALLLIILVVVISFFAWILWGQNLMSTNPNLGRTLYNIYTDVLIVLGVVVFVYWMYLRLRL